MKIALADLMALSLYLNAISNILSLITAHRISATKGNSNSFSMYRCPTLL